MLKLYKNVRVCLHYLHCKLHMHSYMYPSNSWSRIWCYKSSCYALDTSIYIYIVTCKGLWQVCDPTGWLYRLQITGSCEIHYISQRDLFTKCFGGWLLPSSVVLYVAAMVSQSIPGPYRVIWLSLQTTEKISHRTGFKLEFIGLAHWVNTTQPPAPPRVAVQLDLLLVRSTCAAEYNYEHGS